MPIVGPFKPFLTGIESIDTQHRELFESLATAIEAIESGAPNHVIEEVMAYLAIHAIRHCQTEESLMKQAEFPDRISHMNQHQELILQIREIQYQRSKGHIVGSDVIEFLWEWVDHHIRESDRNYVGYLNLAHGN
jgi:hemerythrin-like metal-binding protein